MSSQLDTSSEERYFKVPPLCYLTSNLMLIEPESRVLCGEKVESCLGSQQEEGRVHFEF